MRGPGRVLLPDCGAPTGHLNFVAELIYLFLLAPHRVHNSDSGTASTRPLAVGKMLVPACRIIPPLKRRPHCSAKRRRPRPSEGARVAAAFTSTPHVSRPPRDDEIDLDLILVAIMPEAQVRIGPSGLGHQLLHHKRFKQVPEAIRVSQPVGLDEPRERARDPAVAKVDFRCLYQTPGLTGVPGRQPPDQEQPFQRREVVLHRFPAHGEMLAQRLDIQPAETLRSLHGNRASHVPWRAARWYYVS